MTKEETKNTTEVISGKEGLDKFFSQETETVQEDNSEEKEEAVSATGIDSLFNETEEKPEEKTIISEELDKKEEAAEKVAPNKQSDFYRSLIQENIEDGDWSDAEIDVEDEEGNTVSIPIGEIEDITPEVYRQLKDAQKALREEDFNSKYISKEGLDETTLKMVDLKRAGGDISELIQKDAENIHPLKNLDLENENVQAYVLQQKLLSKGVSLEDSHLIVDRHKKELTLDVEAGKVISEINGNFDKLVESEKQKQLNVIQEQKNSQKDFKKSIKDSLDHLKFNEKHSKALLSAASDFDDDGVTKVDNAYFEAKKNPELYTKLALMLTNEEAYNEYMGIKAKNAANLNALRKLVIKPRTSTSTSSAKKTDKKEGLEALFDSN